MSIWDYTVLASFNGVALLLAVTQRGSPFSRALRFGLRLPFGTNALIALVVTVALASLSWHFFERPFVRVSHRLSY